jgi:hypothetical protein
MSAHKRLVLRYAASAGGLLWGGLLFSRPRLVDRLLDGAGPSHAEMMLTRTLGARHVVEAVALAVPGRRVRRPLLVTEAAHASSMLALGLASPRHRRVALASLFVAAALGLATAMATRGPTS